MIVDFHVRKYLEMPLNIDIAEEKYLTVFFLLLFLYSYKAYPVNISTVVEKWHFFYTKCK